MEKNVRVNYSIDENKQKNKQTNKLDFVTPRQPAKPIAQNVFDAIKVSVMSHEVISC